MASLQDSIANAIRNWPTLYGCRTDVLHHYFCAVDNGMDWHDGVLVDRYGDSTESERASMVLDENERAQIVHDSLRWLARREPPRDIGPAQEDTMMALARITARRHNNELRLRIDHADLLACLPWNDQSLPDGLLGVGAYCRVQPITPLSTATSALFTIPDDVQPDWLAGAREMIFAIFHAPPTSQPVIPLAEDVLQKLHQRFSTPPGVPTTFAEWQASRDCDVDDLMRAICQYA